MSETFTQLPPLPRAVGGAWPASALSVLRSTAAAQIRFAGGDTDVVPHPATEGVVVRPRRNTAFQILAPQSEVVLAKG
jgi:hypothetical protein